MATAAWARQEAKADGERLWHTGVAWQEVERESREQQAEARQQRAAWEAEAEQRAHLDEQAALEHEVEEHMRRARRLTSPKAATLTPHAKRLAALGLPPPPGSAPPRPSRQRALFPSLPRPKPPQPSRRLSIDLLQLAESSDEGAFADDDDNSEQPLFVAASPAHPSPRHHGTSEYYPETQLEERQQPEAEAGGGPSSGAPSFIPDTQPEVLQTEAQGYQLHLERRNRTGYKGVYYDQLGFRAKRVINGTQEYVNGCFETAVEAAAAYAKAVAERPEGRRGQRAEGRELRAEQREGRGQRAEEEQPEGRAEGSPPWQFKAAAEGSKRSIPVLARFSPPSNSPAQRRSDLVQSTRISCMTIGYKRCSSIKGHMIRLLTGPSPKGIPADEWGTQMTRHEAERFVHRLAHKGYTRYREDWKDLFALKQPIPCAGKFDGGSVGGGCPWMNTYSLNGAVRELQANGSVGEYTSKWEMDHSLQPLSRTVQLWKACPSEDLNEDLLLHLIYAVKPAVVDGVRMSAAVIPRCVSCHATWQENHGQLWQVQRQRVPH